MSVFRPGLFKDKVAIVTGDFLKNVYKKNISMKYFDYRRRNWYRQGYI